MVNYADILKESKITKYKLSNTQEYWPINKYADIEIDKSDKFGDAYKVTYQLDDGGFINFYYDTKNKKNTWSYDFLEKKTGTWKNINEVNKIINDMILDTKKQLKTFEKKLPKMKNWDLYVDSYDVSYNRDFLDYSAGITMNIYDYIKNDGKIEWRIGDYGNPFSKYGVTKTKGEIKVKDLSDVKKVLDYVDKQVNEIIKSHNERYNK